MVYGMPDLEKKLIEIMLVKVSGFLSSLHGGQLSWNSIGMEVQKSYMAVDYRL
jgi:hypothetical protein